jgi:ACS family hexuronate transporter-like MFS transporter
MLAPPLVVWAILAYELARGLRDRGSNGAVLGPALAALLPSARRASRHLPRKSARISLPGRRRILLAAGARPSVLSILLRQRNFWGIALPRFLADPTWGTLTFCGCRSI